MARVKDLNSHEGAPIEVKRFYKSYQKLPQDKLLEDSNLIDLSDPGKCAADSRVQPCGTISHAQLERDCGGLESLLDQHKISHRQESNTSTIYTVRGFPGKLRPNLSKGDMLTIQAYRYCLVFFLREHRKSSSPAYYTETCPIHSI